MKYKHFSIEEREKIEDGLWEKRSLRDIANQLGRSHSSLAREIKRNASLERNLYKSRLADMRAEKKKTSRGRKDRLKNERIRSYVISHLKQKWSPEQIAIRISIDMSEHISHEAIYQFIYSRVYFGSNLTKCNHEDLRPYLRRRRRIRLPHGARKCQRVLRPHGPSIDDRPLIVERRARIGDWEGDSVESKDHKPGINTLVERKTGLLMMSKLKNKTSMATAEVMKKRFSMIPQKLKRTVTLDNGPENRDWRLIQEQTHLSIFFAHPYHSWERGTNENTNGLIRDYFPKKTDFDTISDEEISFVEKELNNRPRKRLGGRTPLEVWSGALTH